MSSDSSTRANSATRVSQTPTAAPKRDYSCVVCKRRKIRCDRGDPCASCVDAGVECIMSTRAPYRPRKKLRPTTDPANDAAPDLPLYVGTNGQQAKAASSTPSAVSKSTQSLDGRKAPEFQSNLWTGLNDFPIPGSGDPRSRVLQTQADDDDDTVTTSPASFNASGFLFCACTSPSSINLAESHPTPLQAFTLWQTFLENVNPLSKLIYSPSVQTQVLEASRNFPATSKANAVLLFAIYTAAITSMAEKSCQEVMGESKNALLARYITATQHALIKAGFLKSLDLVVLKAFVLYLLSVRRLYDSHVVWLLSGLAVRMGQRLQLHSERANLGYPAFEAEMRRRVWWQIMLIDGRSAQLSGSPHTINNSDAALPLNLNDADMNPDMSEVPVVHKGATEMIFCLLRYEFGKFMETNGRKLNSNDLSIAEKDQLIEEFESYLESKYLRYCDPAIPLHLISSSGARSGICKMKLVAHHPQQYPDKGASMSRAERDMLFFTSLKMVEYDVLGQTTKQVAHFLWHINHYFQLDAFVFMLIESRHQLSGELADKAWQLTSDVYKYHPELLTDETNELYTAVRELTLRAWDARQMELKRLNPHLPTETPPYIMRLQFKKLANANGNAENADPINLTIEGSQSQSHSTEDAGYGAEKAAGAEIVGDLNDPDYSGQQQPYAGQVDDLTFDHAVSADMNYYDWDYWNSLLESGMPQQASFYTGK